MMTRTLRWWMRGLLLVLMFAAPLAAAFAAPSATASGVRTQVSDVGFRTRSDLVAHYRKHGAEFGRISMAEYLKRAQALRDRRAGGSVLEIVRGDGVITRFDRRSGDFIAFERRGIIRTFFRPRDGERYFRRQALRYSGAP